MPNWCSNSIAFIADDDKYQPELERLRDKLIETRKIKDGGYLSTVLKEHGIDDSNISCRGEILDIREIETTYVENLPCFIIDTETAWSPTPDVWEAICEKYEGIFNVYTAEELGNGILVNTDDMGYRFTDKYRFESYFDCKDAVIKTSIFGIGERFYDENRDISEYFSSDSDVLAFFSRLTGRVFISLSHIKDFFESVNIITDGEINFSLMEYSNG